MFNPMKFSCLFLISYLVFTDAAPGDKLKAKCQEYAKYVNVNEMSPVMSASSKTNSVSKCGIVETPLIVGGVKVGENEFPHMGAIGFKTAKPGKYKFQCGGSLISENIVLTAAHCHADGAKNPPLVVKFGVIYIKDTGSNAQTIEIEKFTNHPNYDPDGKYFDIAIIKLKSNVKFTEFVRPACIATSQPDWKKGIAVGFGKTSHDNEAGSDFLLKVLLSRVDQSTCAKNYKTYKALTKGIQEGQFCAGEKKGDKDACQGDSGGPLQVVLKEPYCMYSVIGVTSFGRFCGFANSYGVYTDVTKYLDFIEQYI